MFYKMKKGITMLDLSDEEFDNMHKIMLELLIEFDRICRKYNIKYSLDGGTFLGAVRHKGFIPWDADADIVIMRKDYDRFYEACKKELDNKHFFLQDYTTDKYYRWGYARLLKVNTEFVRAGHEHMKSKNGIFIDIFTMDAVPDNKLLRVVHKFICFCIRKTLWSEVGKVVHPNIILRGWYWLLSKIPKEMVFKFRNYVAKVCNKNENSELIRHMCGPHPKGYSYGFRRNLFDHLVEYDFEGHKFWAFEEYDFFLKSVYGDYMTPPPIDKRKNQIPCSSYSIN